MSITWGDIVAMFAVLVVGSFVAGAIDAWWEQLKRYKNTRGCKGVRCHFT